MATKRKQRKKNDLSRLSDWPHQVKKNRRISETRHVSINEPHPVRASPLSPVAHELPALYHETYLRVLPQDPYRLFSFWEVAAATAGTASPLLRLYETDSNAQGKKIGDILVEKGARSQYIRVPRPGHRYRLEYGSAPSGRFVPLCSSNEVAVPAARILGLEENVKGQMRLDAEKLTDFSVRAMTVAAAPGNTLTSSFTNSSGS
ncbi:MAG: DUF4912 domain-containing protein [Chitinispirillaceae bacterium]|jgi:hypothetical protein